MPYLIAAVAVIVGILILKQFWVHTILGMLVALASFFIYPPILIGVSVFLLVGLDVLFAKDESETGIYLIYVSLVEITETWNPFGGFLFRFFFGVIFIPVVFGLLALVPYASYIISLILLIQGIQQIREHCW